MAKTLLERAIDIRDEVTEFQNTAERVGSVLVEVVENHTAVEQRVSEVESRSDDMLRDVTLHRQEIAELKSAGTTMQQDVDRIDLLTEAIDDNVTLLNKKNAQQATEIEALKSTDTTLQQELANHQSTLNDHEQFLNEYREAIDEHSRKLSLYPAQMMLDLGTVDTQDAGLALAARSEIAGNRNISFIRFQINGVSALRTTLIIQWPNGENVTAQLVFTDKAQWRRNVSGATGTAGDTTTPTQLERTAPHYIGYDAATRKIQLKDYTQTVSRDVQLPVASRRTDGLLSKTDYANLFNFLILEDNAQGPDSVAVKFPNPVSGAQNKFYLLPASEARAGVMTAALFQELKTATANIAEHYEEIHGLLDNIYARLSALEKKTGIS